MGRLTNLKPTIGTLAPLLGYVPGDEKAQEQQRNSTAPWRKWYATERWKRLRQQVFVRDLYTCQRTGLLCVDRYPAPNSPVANHKVPHRGNPALFWDIHNIETITKAEHDKAVQAEEQSIPKGTWD